MPRLYTIQKCVVFFICAFLLSFSLFYEFLVAFELLTNGRRRTQYLQQTDNMVMKDRLSNATWYDNSHASHQLASSLQDKVQILCWIMTSPSNLYTKAVHLKATWTRKCNKVVFISSEEDKEFPTVGVGGKEGGDFLWVKTRRSLQYLYANHINHADWFLKADDDTFVIMENLRYFLLDKDSNLEVYYGRRFKSAMNQNGYMSGGAGYVMSKMALKMLITKSLSNPFVCPSETFVDMYPGLPEDSALGACMEAAGVMAGDTRDVLGRERFHPLEPVELLDPFFLATSGYWLWDYSFYPSHKGPECCSDYSISFHYVSPNAMYLLEYMIYHMKPFGVGHYTCPSEAEAQVDKLKGEEGGKALDGTAEQKTKEEEVVKKEETNVAKQR